RSFLRDLDMAMHNDHKRTEVSVRSSVRGARIRDQVIAVIDVRGRSTAWLVSPVPVAAFPVPVEITAGSDHQSHEMAFLGTLVVRAGGVDQVVRQCGRTHRSASERGIFRAGRQAGLREGVRAVVSGVVVAVVIELLLPAIVPPVRLVQGRAVAVFPWWPVRSSELPLFPGLLEPLELLQQKSLKLLSQAQLPH